MPRCHSTLVLILVLVSRAHATQGPLPEQGARAGTVLDVPAADPPQDPHIDAAIESIRARISEGSLDAARRELATLLDGGVQALAARSGNQVALPTLLALDEVTGTLVSLDAQLEIRETIHDRLATRFDASHSGVLEAKQSLAATRYALGHIDGAHELFEYVHAARERLLPADHADLLDAKLNLAATCYALGDHEGALGLEEYVHAARERLLPADHPSLLAAKRNLALSRKELGDIEGAHELYDHIHAALERLLPADQPELLSAKLNLATTRKALGDLQGAHALFEYVHAACERLLPADHPSLLDAKQNLASTRYALGDLEGTHELFEYVHAVWARLRPADHPDLLAAKQNLAVTGYALGDLEGASELFEYVHAARARLLPADHVHLLAVKLNLAVTRFGLGDLEGAYRHLDYVHAARERLLPADHFELLTVKLNIATTRKALGDLEGAHELFEYVHAAWARLLPADHPNLLTVKQNLAVTREALGDREGAQRLVSELARGAAQLAAHGLAASPREARAAARDAVQRLAEARLWGASQGVPEEVVRLIFSGLETSRHVATARLLPSASSGSEESARLRDEVRAAEARLDQHVARGPTLPQPSEGEASEQWREAARAAQYEWNRALARLSLERDAKQKALLNELGGSRSLLTVIEAEAVARQLEAGEVAVGITKLGCWDRDDKTATSSYDGAHYIAHLVLANGSVTEIDLGRAGPLEDASERWRTTIDVSHARGLGKRNTEETAELEAGRRLRRLLFDPLTEAAQLAPGGRIFLCVDDALHTLPLDALPLEDALPVEAHGAGRASRAPTRDTTRVGDRFDLRLELSFARLIAPELDPDGPPSLLTVGGIDFDAETEIAANDSIPLAPHTLERGTQTAGRNGTWGSWGSLNATIAEVESIADFARHELGVEAERLSGASLTAQGLEVAARGKRFIHVATHGWFMPESVRSMLDHEPDDARHLLLGTERTVTGFAPLALCGLVLSGANSAGSQEELSARLLTAMELSSFDLSSCELAVLSACETNVGVVRAGQGIQSLQTALHQAGARASLTSLWQVDDYATRDLMRAFYANLWEKRVNKAEALWDAKCQLRRRGEPLRSWAGWVLVGDPD